LKSTIERSCWLRELLADNSLKSLISQIDSLPSQPELYLEIQRELEAKNSSIHRIGEIISRDLGMTAKVLQLVNSAFFGFCRHISSPAEAAELIGLETFKALVLTVKIFSQLDKASMRVFAVDRVWAHSLKTGVFAKTIAAAEKRERKIIDDAFIAGLLHDAGKLILAANLPGQYKEALAAVSSNGGSELKAELDIFGVTHAEVGAYLLALWGLPIPIVEAIAFHHNPRKCWHKELGVLTAVHVGSSLEHTLRNEEKPDFQPDLTYLADLEILPRLPEWEALCRKAIEEGDGHGS
jgi:HD-like signal output (HDOD) protein